MKKQVLGLIVAVAVVSIAILGISKVTYAKGPIVMSSSVQSIVATALSGYLENHPDSKIALMLAQFLVGETPSTPPSTPPAKSFGADLNTDVFLNSGNFNEIGYKNDNTSVYTVTGIENQPFATSTSASSTVEIMHNLTGIDIVVDNVEVNFNSNNGNTNVSSTFQMFVASSTIASLAYTATPYSSWLDTILVTTSTATSTFNSLAPPSTIANGIHGIGSAILHPNEYLLLFFKNPYTCSVGATCENVTSTNRGWAGNVIAKFHFLRTY